MYTSLLYHFKDIGEETDAFDGIKALFSVAHMWSTCLVSSKDGVRIHESPSTLSHDLKQQMRVTAVLLQYSSVDSSQQTRAYACTCTSTFNGGYTRCSVSALGRGVGSVHTMLSFCPWTGRVAALSTTSVHVPPPEAQSLYRLFCRY